MGVSGSITPLKPPNGSLHCKSDLAIFIPSDTKKWYLTLMPAILTERIIEEAAQIAVGLHRSFAGVLRHEQRGRGIHAGRRRAAATSLPPITSIR